MRQKGIFVALVGCVALLLTSTASVQVGGNDVGSEGNGTVVMRDDCDPTDRAGSRPEAVRSPEDQ